MTSTERLIATLRPEVESVRQSLAELQSQLAAEDLVGAYFLERLKLAIESTDGSIVLANTGLAYPVAIMARTTLELTMITFWAASTQERAIEASGASVAELTRDLKGLLAKGHGKITNKRTGEDKTAWMLGIIEKQGKQPRKQISEMARECGLGRLYERFYPLQSMPSHGHSLGLSGGQKENQALYALMAAIRGHLKAINFTVAKRINLGQATTLAELDEFLNVGLVPPTCQS